MLEIILFTIITILLCTMSFEIILQWMILFKRISLKINMLVIVVAQDNLVQDNHIQKYYLIQDNLIQDNQAWDNIFEIIFAQDNLFEIILFKIILFRKMHSA